MLAAHADQPAEAFIVPSGLTTAQVYIPRLRTLLPGEDREALRGQNPCSGLTFELFVADGGVPDRENNICRELEVNALTLQEATPETDAALVVEGFFLVPPIAAGQTEPDPEIIKWLRFNKVRFVDEDEDGAKIPTPAITIPREGVELGRGHVLVQGSANTRDLLRWTLSAAPGVSPPAAAFQVITSLERGIAGGQLGRWDTRTLLAGPYVLRLTIEDDLLGELVIERRVTLKDAETPRPVAPEATHPPHRRRTPGGTALRSHKRVRADGMRCGRGRRQPPSGAPSSASSPAGVVTPRTACMNAIRDGDCARRSRRMGPMGLLLSGRSA